MAKRQARTDNHDRIYAHLRKAHAPLTAYQLLEALGREGFNSPVTIYRALNRLVSEGRVHRLESLNAFVACCAPQACYHVPIFTICRDCGSVQEVVQSELLDRLSAFASMSGFAVAEAFVELRGRCAKCVDAANAS